MSQVWLLTFVAGFLALSIETLWTRLFGFANHSLPQTSSFVLTLFLVGIVLGILLGRKLCQHSKSLWDLAGFVLLLASFFALLNPWVYAAVSQTTLQIVTGSLLIVFTGLLSATIFPIAYRLGMQADDLRIGRFMIASLLGATLGALITNMLFLDWFTAQECFSLCAFLTLLLSLYCWQAYAVNLMRIISGAWVLLIVVFTFLPSPSALLAKAASPVGELHRIVENRQGVITLYKSAEGGGDLIFADNVYEGRTNLDPVVNSNGINRLLILSALQDKPQRVLLIGLSMGTWLTLLTSFPEVQHIDVLETNPGYLALIKEYPKQKHALADARVKVNIADSRKWLQAHADDQYDLIVLNTNLNYANNLLSQKFMQMLKAHMAENAVLAFVDPDALKTAAEIFPHTYLYQNMVIAADFDWRKNLVDPESVNKLATLFLNGYPLFPVWSEGLIKQFLHQPLHSPS